MKLHLSAPSSNKSIARIAITGSKSETNRLLLLQALFPNLQFDNRSNSDDAQVMAAGLVTTKGTVDIHHAGTAMRFLTAYFACLEGCDVRLTGSSRMKERPIQILVEALNSLGANIQYEEKEGYPPLLIKGKTLSDSSIELPADISSQYISALLLVAPKLTNGLKLELQGKITSVPYIKMTLALLNSIGLETNFTGNTIQVQPKNQIKDTNLTVESDWSSASYFYSITALSAIGSQLELTAYKEDSLQGDSVLSKLYQDFGVETTFEAHKIILRKVKKELSAVTYDLSNAPDIAQTISVTCLGLGMECNLTGLHTLPIKETDRLAALKTELTKLGATVAITPESLHMQAVSAVKSGIEIDTYNDHRMAMAFAPLALCVPITIKDSGVVSKSYPDFWKDLEKLNFSIKSE